MPDYIKGPVLEIIDKDTITVAVEFVGKSNQKEYDGIERIHINTLEPPFLKDIPVEKQIMRLEKKLLNQVVYCYLQGKNKEQEHIAKVKCDGPRFRGKRKRV